MKEKVKSARKKSAYHIETAEKSALHTKWLDSIDKLREAGTYSDCTLMVSGVELKAHRNILAAISPIFEKLFSKEAYQEERDGIVRIEDPPGLLKDSTAKPYQALLSYAYSGSVDWSIYGDCKQDVLVVACNYLVLDLKHHVERQLAREMTAESLAELALLADSYSCDQLKKACVWFLFFNCLAVVLTPQWGDLMEARGDLAKELLRLVREDETTSSYQYVSIEIDKSALHTKWLDSIDKLRETGAHSDCYLMVGGEELKAHRLILSAISPIFGKMFSNEGFQEARDGIVRIEDPPGLLKDSTAEPYQAVLSYAYTGCVDWSIFGDCMQDVLVVACKYLILDLKHHVEKLLINEITAESLAELALLADTYSCDQLKKACVQFLSFHYSTVVLTPEWGDLMETKGDLAKELLRLTAEKSALHTKWLDSIDKLRETGMYSDCTLMVSGVELKAHRNILAAISPIFEKMFSKGAYQEARDGIVRIEDPPGLLKDSTAKPYQALLSYSYSGNVDWSIFGDCKQDVLVVACKYLVLDLKHHVEKLLINEITAESLAELALLADTYSCEKLKKACVHYLSSYSTVVLTPQWGDLMEARGDLAKELLRRVRKGKATATDYQNYRNRRR